MTLWLIAGGQVNGCQPKPNGNMRLGVGLSVSGILGEMRSQQQRWQTMVEMLNKGVTPFVCQKGSVGASGDLAPMSQVALLMLGEGEAYYKGELLDGKIAMERAGIPIPGLMARDGLAIINGSNLLTAMSAIMKGTKKRTDGTGIGTGKKPESESERNRNRK